VLAILAPGQGAQAPRQLCPWLDLDPVADRLRWWSAAVGVDLLDAGCDAPAETIRDTAVAQPLLVATGLIASEQLDLPFSPADRPQPHEPNGNPPGRLGDPRGPQLPPAHGRIGDDSPQFPSSCVVVAGHSVGELTAAVLNGTLTPEAALVLVGLRGREMAAASARRPTGMTAVVGGDPEVVTSHLAELGLTAANRNGAGQIVAAGTVEDLARLAENPPAGSRVRSLAVAGAFHTHHMEPAREALAQVMAGIRPGVPMYAQVSNADGAVVTDGAEMVRRLVAQVSAPVRWDLCMVTLRELGVTAVLELPPAGVLASIAKRELPGVTVLAIKSPADLPAARELVAEHARPDRDRPDRASPASSRPDDDALVGASS
jgi:[acyl-carrier-protein] S-malonyltransferase